MQHRADRARQLLLIERNPWPHDKARGEVENGCQQGESGLGTAPARSRLTKYLKNGHKLTTSYSPALKASRSNSVSGSASHRRRLVTVGVRQPGMGLSYATAITWGSGVSVANTLSDSGADQRQ